MKKTAKALLTLGIAAGAVGSLVLGLASKSKPVKAEAAVNLGAVKYIPVNSDNFYKENNNLGKGGTGVGELTSGRRDTFHDGRRMYNALDDFINTMAKTGEGETGWIRSNEWVHTGGYVSFLLGGNSNCFVNIWAEPEGVENTEGYLPGENVVDHAHNDFYASRDAYDSAYIDGNESDFELSANMALKYYQIPDRLIGRRLIIYMEDTATGYYGGITFGDLRVNQTLEEVAKTFSTHKKQIDLDAGLTNQNAFSANYMLNTYYKDQSKYGDLITAEAALDNADEGFEEYRLTNWAYDRSNSSVDGINFAGIVSSNDAKDWAEKMPANKTDNFYINADVSGIGEGEKYRLVSSEFTLSGTGFISAKLGGGTAVMSLIDSSGFELTSTRIAPSVNENILNIGFADNGGVGNIMESGSRYNTMSRTYLDASAHLGKRVRVVLSDDRTGNNWGLAYFDEVVTYYDTIPTLQIDLIHQQFNDTPTYYGVVTDKYVGSGDTTFGKAYDFVQDFYTIMRSNGAGRTYCSLLESNDVANLLAAYENLDVDTKALVDAAQDFDFGKSAVSTDWYLTQANIGFTVGSTMSYVSSVLHSASSPMKSSNLVGDRNTQIHLIVICSLFATTSMVLLLVLRKKRLVK